GEFVFDEFVERSLHFMSKPSHDPWIVCRVGRHARQDGLAKDEEKGHQVRNRHDSRWKGNGDATSPKPAFSAPIGIAYQVEQVVGADGTERYYRRTITTRGPHAP